MCSNGEKINANDGRHEVRQSLNSMVIASLLKRISVGRLI